VFIAFFLALIVFIQIAKMVFLENKRLLDDSAFRFLRKYETGLNNRIMTFFSFLGSHYFLIPANILIICYFLFVRKHKWYSIKIPVISIGSLLLMFFLKFIFNRPRPLLPLLKEAKGLSFPSGHALNAMVFYGLLIYLVLRNIENPRLRRLLITMLCIIILMIGTSRVYLRVHYASDVVAGYSVGLMWLILSLWILKKMENYSKARVAPVLENNVAN
jgi:undecaprenyl-diphosphatase